MRRILLLLLLPLVACASAEERATSETLRLLGPHGEEILLTVEIADEPGALRRGLMGRTSLAPDHGMLFIEPTERVLHFWMKNTLIPLDILYFDAQGQFVSSATMIPCMADPCPTYESKGPAMYGLEVSAGFVQDNGVGKDWKILNAT